jgi:hypothetical protein
MQIQRCASTLGAAGVWLCVVVQREAAVVIRRCVGVMIGSMFQSVYVLVGACFSRSMARGLKQRTAP